jgi:hypothetical protein
MIVGDIVRYVGDDIAKERSKEVLSFWGSLGCNIDTLGIVESQCEEVSTRGKKGSVIMRYDVRILRGEMFVHINHLFYDFEVEKV